MAVGEALKALTSQRWRLSYELREERRRRRRRAAASASSEEEWVRRFIDEFDAEEVSGDWQPARGEAGGEDERGVEAVTSNEKGA